MKKNYLFLLFLSVFSVFLSDAYGMEENLFSFEDLTFGNENGNEKQENCEYTEEKEEENTPYGTSDPVHIVPKKSEKYYFDGENPLTQCPEERRTKPFLSNTPPEYSFCGERLWMPYSNKSNPRIDSEFFSKRDPLSQMTGQKRIALQPRNDNIPTVEQSFRSTKSDILNLAEEELEEELAKPLTPEEDLFLSEQLGLNKKTEEELEEELEAEVTQWCLEQQDTPEEDKESIEKRFLEEVSPFFVTSLGPCTKASKYYSLKDFLKRTRKLDFLELDFLKKENTNFPFMQEELMQEELMQEELESLRQIQEKWQKFRNEILYKFTLLSRWKKHSIENFFSFLVERYTQKKFDERCRNQSKDSDYKYLNEFFDHCDKNYPNESPFITTYKETIKEHGYSYNKHLEENLKNKLTQSWSKYYFAIALEEQAILIKTIRTVYESLNEIWEEKVLKKEGIKALNKQEGIKELNKQLDIQIKCAVNFINKKARYVENLVASDNARAKKLLEPKLTIKTNFEGKK